MEPVQITKKRHIARLLPGSRMSQGVIHAGTLYTAGQVDAEVADVAGQTKNILQKMPPF